VANAFPSTNVTWILERLSAGDEGRSDVRQHVMARYARPLAAYVQGSSLRDLGEPEEIVHGFFAAALARDDYFERWRTSGARLRRWLLNGLLLHAKGLRRDRGRERARIACDLEDAEAIGREASAERAFERAWAERLLAEACALASSRLADAGKGRRFELFRRHVLNGERAIDVADDLGFRRTECSAIIRGVTNEVRRSLRELVQQDGVADADLDEEVAHLRSLLDIA
jgi:hypothetical protein